MGNAFQLLIAKVKPKQIFKIFIKIFEIFLNFRKFELYLPFSASVSAWSSAGRLQLQYYLRWKWMPKGLESRLQFKFWFWIFKWFFGWFFWSSVAKKMFKRKRKFYVHVWLRKKLQKLGRKLIVSQNLPPELFLQRRFFERRKSKLRFGIGMSKRRRKFERLGKQRNNLSPSFGHRSLPSGNSSVFLQFRFAKMRGIYFRRLRRKRKQI